MPEEITKALVDLAPVVWEQLLMSTIVDGWILCLFGAIILVGGLMGGRYIMEDDERGLGLAVIGLTMLLSPIIIVYGILHLVLTEAYAVKGLLGS